MDNNKIAEYLQKEVDTKKFSLWGMDKRREIPRRIKREILELESMINFLLNKD